MKIGMSALKAQIESSGTDSSPTALLAVPTRGMGGCPRLTPGSRRTELVNSLSALSSGINRAGRS